MLEKWLCSRVCSKAGSREIVGGRKFGCVGERGVLILNKKEIFILMVRIGPVWGFFRNYPTIVSKVGIIAGIAGINTKVDI